MFSIRKIIKEELLNESVKLPIEIGDTVYMGKFKNKKTIVKKIEWNEKGDLMINGKSALRVRIPKKVKKLKESEGFLDSTEEDFEWVSDAHPLNGLDETKQYKVWFGQMTEIEKKKMFKNLFNISDKFREADYFAINDHYPGTLVQTNGTTYGHVSQINSIFLEWEGGRWDISFMGGWNTNRVPKQVLEYSRNYFDSRSHIELPKDLFL